MFTKQDLKASKYLIIQDIKYLITNVVERETNKYGNLKWPVQSISVMRTIPRPRISSPKIISPKHESVMDIQPVSEMIVLEDSAEIF